MSAIILAGGMATRMSGKDKAFLLIKRKTIIKRQVSLLKKIVENIIIVSNSPDRYENFKDVKIVTDIVKGIGPLGGIYSGLMASRDKFNFVIACDMPFISEPLIRYMVGNIGDYDAMVPKIGKRLHPLFGIYSKKCVRVIKAMIRKNDLKVAGIYPQVKTKFLTKREIRRFDKGEKSFVNINTPDEFRQNN